jgi:hypothetical protein
MKNPTMAQSQQVIKKAKEIHQNDDKESQKDFMKLSPKDKMKYISKAEKEKRKSNVL